MSRLLEFLYEEFPESDPSNVTSVLPLSLCFSLSVGSSEIAQITLIPLLKIKTQVKSYYIKSKAFLSLVNNISFYTRGMTRSCSVSPVSSFLLNSMWAMVPLRQLFISLKSCLSSAVGFSNFVLQKSCVKKE